MNNKVLLPWHPRSRGHIDQNPSLLSFSGQWLVGLGVWFSLWVREVPGSNPGRAHPVLISINTSRSLTAIKQITIPPLSQPVSWYCGTLFQCAFCFPLWYTSGILSSDWIECYEQCFPIVCTKTDPVGLVWTPHYPLEIRLSTILHVALLCLQVGWQACERYFSL